MTAFSKVDMAEVTRLTRAGRLGEALALIQGRAPVAAASAKKGADPDPALLDMVPPSFPGGAWTAEAEAASSPRKAAPAEVRTPRTGALRDRLSGLVLKLDIRPGRTRVRPMPAPAPDGARFEERTFSNGAGSRTYKVYVPSGHSGAALPVIVMLHGCTQDPDDFAAGTRMNEIAEEQRFLVVYPRQSQSANMQKCWNWFNAADQQRGAGEPSLIAGIALDAVAEFSADPGRVYVAGLSAGGAAAAVLAATYPDVFAAVGIHSGLAHGAAFDIPSAFAAMSGKVVAPGAGNSGAAIPTIVFHGDSDRTVNSVNADRAIAQARPEQTLRRTVTSGKTPAGMSYTRSIEFDGEERAILEQWTLHGAGHAWSGGSPAGSYVDPRGPDASREMTRFFLSHTTRSPPRS